MYQHSPLRIGAVGTHVVGFLSKGLLRKAKPLVIFPGCGTRIEAIGLMFLGAKKKTFESQIRALKISCLFARFKVVVSKLRYLYVALCFAFQN